MLKVDQNEETYASIVRGKADARLVHKTCNLNVPGCLDELTGSIRNEVNGLS